MNDDVLTYELERYRRQVGNALWLLDFAMSTGRDVPDDALTPILRAQDLAAATTLPSVEERIAFDRAYSALARLVAPVTADTLRWTSDDYALWAEQRRDPQGTHRSFFARWGPVSDAKIWSRKLWVITVFVVLALFICEPFAKPAPAGNDGERAPAADGKPPGGPANDKGVPGSKPNAGPAWNVVWFNAQATKRAQPPARIARRVGTPTPTLPPPIPTPTNTSTRPPATATPTVGTGLKSLCRTGASACHGVLGDLGTLLGTFLCYLCPFLYGALGALAFLLRACHEYIHRREFDQRRVPEYYNRILLGALSGGAIQLYLTSKLTPVDVGVGANAIAFIAGYNTDLLFSYLDRIFSALLPKDPSPSPALPSAPATAATTVTTPSSPIAQADERVARIQRFLAETGMAEYAVSASDGIWDERTRLAIVVFLRSNYAAVKAFATMLQAPDFASYDREQLIAAMSSFVLPAATT